jgi:hypothetical protein
MTVSGSERTVRIPELNSTHKTQKHLLKFKKRTSAKETAAVCVLKVPNLPLSYILPLV